MRTTSDEYICGNIHSKETSLHHIQRKPTLLHVWWKTLSLPEHGLMCELLCVCVCVSDEQRRIYACICMRWSHRAVVALNTEHSQLPDVSFSICTPTHTRHNMTTFAIASGGWIVPSHQEWVWQDVRYRFGSVWVGEVWAPQTSLVNSDIHKGTFWVFLRVGSVGCKMMRGWLRHY